MLRRSAGALPLYFSSGESPRVERPLNWIQRPPPPRYGQQLVALNLRAASLKSVADPPEVPRIRTVSGRRQRNLIRPTASFEESGPIYPIALRGAVRGGESCGESRSSTRIQ